MKPDRLKEIEEMLAQLYQDRSQYDRLLGVETDPLEYRKLGIKQELCKQNIERYEREFEELEDKQRKQQALANQAPLIGPSSKLATASETQVAVRKEISPALRRHYDKLIDLFKQGRVLPVLGADINLCGRAPGTVWEPHSPYLPTEKELAAYLARNFEYPETDSPGLDADLAWISQYATVMNGGPGPLYDELRNLFDSNVTYRTTPVHNFLAKLPIWLAGQSPTPRFPIIMTTNYDNVLEQAFERDGQPYDLVSYVAEGSDRDQFLHWSYDRKDFTIIKSANDYRDLPLYQRTVILKMHGAVNRERPERDSFVITEDHYINYLTSTEISKLVPTSLIDKLRWSYLLFLGYNLRDWSLRVSLHRIWGQSKLAYPSWAIELDPQDLDRQFWKDRNVELLEIPLEEYLNGLSERMQQG